MIIKAYVNLEWNRSTHTKIGEYNTKIDAICAIEEKLEELYSGQWEKANDVQWTIIGNYTDPILAFINIAYTRIEYLEASIIQYYIQIEQMKEELRKLKENAVK